MKLSGNWNGVILYGPEYDDWENKELLFKMTIQQTGDTFTAVAYDTGGIGCNPDKAEITGFISGDKISFTKQYISTLTYDDQGQVIILKNKPSPIVEYQGYINKLVDKVSGEWQINILVKQFKDQWLDETYTGQWYMIRQV